MEDKLINSDTAKLAKQKNILNSSKFSYYIILGDTYYKDHHKGDEYLAYKENEIICRAEFPFQTSCLEIGSAYTQSSLQTHLRDVYDIHVEVNFSMRKEEGLQYFVDVGMVNIENESYESKFHKDKFNSYEEALEAGLFEGLKLIEE